MKQIKFACGSINITKTKRNMTIEPVVHDGRGRNNESYRLNVIFKNKYYRQPVSQFIVNDIEYNLCKCGRLYEVDGDDGDGVCYHCAIKDGNKILVPISGWLKSELIERIKKMKTSRPMYQIRNEVIQEIEDNILNWLQNKIHNGMT